MYGFYAYTNAATLRLGAGLFISVYTKRLRTVYLPIRSLQAETGGHLPRQDRLQRWKFTNISLIKFESGSNITVKSKACLSAVTIEMLDIRCEELSRP